MTEKGFVAEASITINAPVAQVWDSLTNPEIIKQYMFGTQVVSEWKVGSPIVWRGEWQGKPYEDKGEILDLEPQRLLRVTHYSPLSGAPDVPDSYHTLTYELTADGNATYVRLSQDNNASTEEADHSAKMWEAMLMSMKNVLEKG